LPLNPRAGIHDTGIRDRLASDQGERTTMPQPPLAMSAWMLVMKY
jgi:hypothetical protein